MLKFTILGYGVHASEVMLKAFAEVDEADLIVVGSETQWKREVIMREHPLLQVVDSYQRAIEHPAVEVVYIALPNHLHAEWTVKALEAGKHVLCEKPLALTALEAEHVTAAAQKAKKFVAEAFMYRCHPQHQVVKTILAEGEIGEIINIEARFSYQLLLSTASINNIRLRKETAGGGLNDGGCYGIDLARFLLGTEPIKVESSFHYAETGVDQSGEFSLWFPGNVCCRVFCGLNAPRTNDYTIQGTKGKIQIHDAFHVPRNKKPIMTITRQKKSERKVLSAANQYVLGIKHCIAAIQTPQSQPILLEDGTANARVLEMVRNAASIHKAVSSEIES